MGQRSLLVVYYGDPVVPVVLVVVDIGPQALVEVLVNDLCLAIGLWVVRGGQLELRADPSAELTPEVRHELWPPIGYDRLRHSHMAYHVLEEERCELPGRDCVSYRYCDWALA